MSLLSSVFEAGGSVKGGMGFPVSSQRTTVAQRQQQQEAVDRDAVSEISSRSSPVSFTNSLSFPPRAPSPMPDSVPEPSFRRVSRSSVMRLENILNDGPTPDHPSAPRSRSLGRSPVKRYASVSIFSTSSSPDDGVHIARSQSPEETVVKKKKVKMHRCPECQKDFPRPSGLRTHMNMHTKEKPFGCRYPGCTRTFSVFSNAKRHMRTHGLGISADDSEAAAVPYVVGFEDPMVVEAQPVPLDQDARRAPGQPMRLRWIGLDGDPGLGGGGEGGPG